MSLWTALHSPPALPEEFVRQQQRALLDAIYAQPKSADPYCDYGFALCRRRERGRCAFGVVTPAGESIPLTERLLFTLGFERCRLSSGEGLALLPAPPVAGDADLALEEIWVELRGPLVVQTERLGGTEAWRSGRMGTVLKAANFDRPLIVLTVRQPLGWPV